MNTFPSRPLLFLGAILSFYSTSWCALWTGQERLANLSTGPTEDFKRAYAGYSPLQVAVMRSQSERVKALMQERPYCLEVESVAPGLEHAGFSLLHLAIWYGPSDGAARRVEDSSSSRDWATRKKHARAREIIECLLAREKERGLAGRHNRRREERQLPWGQTERQAFSEQLATQPFVALPEEIAALVTSFTAIDLHSGIAVEEEALYTPMQLAYALACHTGQWSLALSISSELTHGRINRYLLPGTRTPLCWLDHERHVDDDLLYAAYWHLPDSLAEPWSPELAALLARVGLFSLQALESRLIWIAAVRGDTGAFKALLQERLAIPAENNTGETTFFQVVCWGDQISFFEALYEEQGSLPPYALLDYLTLGPNSAKQVQTVAWMLDHGASPYIWDEQGHSPLDYACMYSGDLEIVESLLAHDLTLSPVRIPVMSWAHLFSYLGLVNARDKLGMTVLHEACLRGDHAMASLLLAYGAWVNAKGPEGTPLAIAVNRAFCRGDAPLAALLLEHGANPDTPVFGEQGATCLHKAAAFTSQSYENGDVIEVLCRFGASVNIRNAQGETPLHIACRYGHLTGVRILAKYGASITLPNNRAMSPLEVARQRGHKEVVKLLSLPPRHRCVEAYTAYRGMEREVSFKTSWHQLATSWWPEQIWLLWIGWQEDERRASIDPRPSFLA